MIFIYFQHFIFEYPPSRSLLSGGGLGDDLRVIRTRTDTHIVLVDRSCCLAHWIQILLVRFVGRYARSAVVSS